MKLLKLSLFFLFLSAQSFAQADAETPYIEVRGTATQKVIPDEIYLAFRINEYQNNKEAKDLDSQEKAIKEALLELGVGLENLSLTSSNSHLRSSGWFKADETVLYRSYELLVHDAETVKAVMIKLGEFQVAYAHINRVDHSRLPEIRKEVRIQAIKAAKEKAEYLLAAVDAKIDMPLIISEVDTDGILGGLSSQYGNANIRGSRGNETVYFIDGVQTASMPSVEFNPLDVSCTIYVKFSITKDSSEE